MKSAELQDTFIREDLLKTFDGVAQHLAAWLQSKLLRHVGQKWWERNIYEVLNDEDRARIDSGEWKALEDLDLHGLLKALDRNFRFLKGRERLDEWARELIREMQQVRHRCIGHRPSRGNSLDDLSGDVATTGKFCKFLGAPEDLIQKVRTLYISIEAKRKEPARTVGSPPAISTAPPATDSTFTPQSRRRPLAGFFAGHQLTESQTQAVADLQRFMDDPNERCFILRGYAGTGKTFLIGGLVRYLEAERRHALMMAPTGRAAHVLRDRHHVEAGTIHRTIYSLKNLQEYREVDENGDITFKFYFETKNNDSQHDTVFIVDEASMISDVHTEAEFMHFGTGRLLHDLMEFINFDANDYRKKLLLVGDRAQLPPVDMNFSPALDKAYLATHCRLKCGECELVDVVRQLDLSLVLRNATRMRLMLQADRFPSFDFESDNETVVELNPADFVRRFAASYERKATRPRSVIVAYTNADITNYNTAVRNILMPGVTAITAGDRIIVVKNNYNYDHPILNGQMGLVAGIGEQLETRSIPVNVGLDKDGRRKNEVVKLQFRDVTLRFEGEVGEEFELPCKIIEDCLDNGSAGLPSNYSKALWADFRQRHPDLRPADPVFRKTICADPYFNAVLVKFGYAVTCHKAQGGEWETVYVDFDGMNKLGKAELRWSYTALTRAARSVVATNALHHGLLTPKKRPVMPLSSPVPAVPIVPAAPESAVAPKASVAPGAATDGQTFFQTAMRDEVQSRLSPGWKITATTHAQFQEGYTITKEDYVATARVFYNSGHKVSRVSLIPGTRTDLDDELHSALSSLKGITIGAANGTNGAVESAHALFIDKLRSKSREAGLTVIRFESKTRFHLVGTFRVGPHEGSFDYYFDKAGRFCSAATPHPGVAPGLAERVLRLHDS